MFHYVSFMLGGVRACAALECGDAELAIFRVISPFGATGVSQNVEITRKSQSTRNGEVRLQTCQRFLNIPAV